LVCRRVAAVPACVYKSVMLRPPADAATVAGLLNDLAFGFAIIGDPRRPGAYRSGARIIKKLGSDLPRALESGDLLATKGIGKGIVGIVEAALAGEEIAVQRELTKTLPEGLLQARQVRGLGPGRARALWQTLGVTSVAEIEYACNENRLIELPGFSDATQAKILAAIVDLRDRAGRLRIDQAWATVRATLERLQTGFAVQAVAVGDLRRGCETVTEVEVAVLCPGRTHPTIDGVTVHVCQEPTRYGALVAYTSASDGHLALLQQRAANMGLQLSADGLSRAGTWLETPDEASVYAALDLHLPAAERREADVPLRPLDEQPERLVERADLQGALHNHTTASDGVHTLEQMRDAAAALGLRYLGISDHSQTASYAGGLSEERLVEQAAAIARANAEGSTCTLLTGVESDILRDGSLDYPDSLLDDLEVVVASVHNRFGQSRDAMTARMVAAASHRHGDIVGHPTGRLLLGRPAADVDMAAFFDACAQSGTAVELNANPQRLDLNVQHLRMAKERGLKVSIAADAHSTAGLLHLEHGVVMARRAGLAKEDVLNCLSLPELKVWIATRRAVSTNTHADGPAEAPC
jgi:DNA polymerase (family X)